VGASAKELSRVFPGTTPRNPDPKKQPLGVLDTRVWTLRLQWGTGELSVLRQLCPHKIAPGQAARPPFLLRILSLGKEGQGTHQAGDCRGWKDSVCRRRLQ
jgi:hypothetical protein